MKCLVNHILSQNKQYISISKVYQYPHEDLKHPETVSTIMSSKPQLPERCVTVPKGRPHRLSVICFLGLFGGLFFPTPVRCVPTPWYPDHSDSHESGLETAVHVFRVESTLEVLGFSSPWPMPYKAPPSE